VLQMSVANTEWNGVVTTAHLIWGDNEDILAFPGYPRGSPHKPWTQHALQASGGGPKDP